MRFPSFIQSDRVLLTGRSLGAIGVLLLAFVTLLCPLDVIKQWQTGIQVP